MEPSASASESIRDSIVLGFGPENSETSAGIKSAIEVLGCSYTETNELAQFLGQLTTLKPHVVLFHTPAPHESVVLSTREAKRITSTASLLLALRDEDLPLVAGFLQAGGHEVMVLNRLLPDAIGASVIRASERARLLERIQALESELRRARRIIELRDWVDSSVLRYGRRLGLAGMTGNSEKMQELYERIERVAAHPDINVTILGERGTGKSLLARAVHDLGPRRDLPYQKFLCSRFQSADPRITMCELFGWGPNPPVKDLDRRGGRGLLEEARGGTVFLDELGDIPQLGQNLLIDVVEYRRFSRPLGRPDEVQVPVRFIFATNRVPRELIEAGVLRSDFWDRINEIMLTVPPLRQRTEDIPLLVQHFVELYNQRLGRRVTRLTQAAVERLQQYEWPGNVRELETTIKRALVMSDGDTLDVPDLELQLVEEQELPLDALVSRLWALIGAGRLEFRDVIDFKIAWGTEITRRIVERAVRESGSIKNAGSRLGAYADADADQPGYAKFRNDWTRLRRTESK